MILWAAISRSFDVWTTLVMPHEVTRDYKPEPRGLPKDPNFFLQPQPWAKLAAAAKRQKKREKKALGLDDDDDGD